MRNRVLLIVVLAVLVLAGLALKMRSGERVDELTSHALMSDEQLQQLASVDHITLSRGQDQVELAKEDGQWGVLSHAGFPVQQERLAALLHALRGARVVEEKTDNPDYHQRLGLDTEAADSEALQVQLHAADQDFGVIYGNRVGNGQLVRFIDSNQVLLINRPFGISVNPTDWLALNVVDIPLTEVSNAHWLHADGESLTMNKKAEGEYNLQLEGVAPEEQAGTERWINSMVLALVNLTAQNVSLRADLELAEPMLRMEVTTNAGSVLKASLHDVKGRYWLLIDSLERAEQDGSLVINDDPRWAYQIGIAQLESLNQRQADIVRKAKAE